MKTSLLSKISKALDRLETKLDSCDEKIDDFVEHIISKIKNKFVR